MNTNSNTYTIIYTAAVVVVVAAILAFVSQKLGPMQEANDKAETISQILTAGGFGDKEHWQQIGNFETISFYKDNLGEAVMVDRDGVVTDTLSSSRIISLSELKEQNYNIRDNAELSIPVYVFKNGIKVLPVYGAGLWGPIWGYIAVGTDGGTIVGAYFDHASETPGLGGKIKDDPAFRAQFTSKSINLDGSKPFSIVKGGANGRADAVDAITGATMTSKGLDAAIAEWLGAYRNTLREGASGQTMEETSNE